MEALENTNSNKRKASKTSVACAACKSRKTKCTGGVPPCSSCVRLNTVCVFHPGSDMRRKDSKDHFKAYKAVLDAFVASTRSGDVTLSSSLYRAIQLTDSTGKLAEIAQSYAQAIQSPGGEKRDLDSEFEYKFGKTTMNLPANSPTTESHLDTDTLMDIFASVSPNTGSDSEAQPSTSNSVRGKSKLVSISETVLAPAVEYVDVASQTDLVDSVRQPHRADRRFYTLRSPSDEQPLATFSEIQALWSRLWETNAAAPTLQASLLGSGCDFYMVQAEDPMSKAITDFRDGARHAIQGGSRIQDIIGTAVPSLDALFSEHTNTPAYSAWSWACQFARALSLPLTLQLATTYIVGIQMRFLILPSAETFDDLPSMLKPVRKQYILPHPAAIDICHFPKIKDLLLTDGTGYDTFLIRLFSSQSCNWPYSDSACFAPNQNSQSTITMSRAFIEHISQVENFSLSDDVSEAADRMLNHQLEYLDGNVE